MGEQNWDIVTYKTIAVCRKCEGIAPVDDDGWPFGAVCPCGGRFTVAVTGAAILENFNQEQGEQA